MLSKQEADNRLRQAIIDQAEAYGLREDSEMLNEFSVISHWVAVEDDGKSRYTTTYHHPSVPDHTAIGLLEMGLALIRTHITRYSE